MDYKKIQARNKFVGKISGKMRKRINTLEKTTVNPTNDESPEGSAEESVSVGNNNKLHMKMNEIEGKKEGGTYHLNHYHCRYRCLYCKKKKGWE